MEGESRRFRPGEHEGRLWGGNISCSSFPQALWKLMLANNLESQLALSKAIGRSHNQTVSTWLSGKSLPSVDSMGELIQLFNPDSKDYIDYDNLIEAYCHGLRQGKGTNGMLLMKGSELTKKIGRTLIKPGLTPIDRWVEAFSLRKSISVTELAGLLGFKYENDIRSNDKLGLGRFYQIIDNSFSVFKMDEQEQFEVVEAVAQTIEQQIAAGHKYKPSDTLTSILTLQKQAGNQTFNNVQASKILARSHQRIGQIKRELGLRFLTTQEDLEVIRERLANPHRRGRKKQAA